MQKSIDLTFTVNNEGLTGKDLLATFMREFAKHGLYIAGVIIAKEPGFGIQIFGHQGKDEQNWAIKAMEYAVFKHNNAALLVPERLSSQEN